MPELLSLSVNVPSPDETTPLTPIIDPPVRSSSLRRLRSCHSHSNIQSSRTLHYRKFSAQSGSQQHSPRNPGLPSSPSAYIADVPSSVRSLLLSTQHLQDLLRSWSTGSSTETQVSDAFVEVGTFFNATVRAFAWHHIDLSDIHSIPQELRQVLEQCLGEDPSPKVLEEFMPSVRKVLFRLLKGLQAREEAWKAAGAGLSGGGRSR